MDSISVIELKSLLDGSPDDVVLLDVRNPAEAEVAVIPGAVLIPLATIKSGEAIERIRGMAGRGAFGKPGVDGYYMVCAGALLSCWISQLGGRSAQAVPESDAMQPGSAGPWTQSRRSLMATNDLYGGIDAIVRNGLRRIAFYWIRCPVAVPAQAYDFGQGVAAILIFMLESGYSRREVENDWIHWNNQRWNHKPRY